MFRRAETESEHQRNGLNRLIPSNNSPNLAIGYRVLAALTKDRAQFSENSNDAKFKIWTGETQSQLKNNRGFQIRIKTAIKRKSTRSKTQITSKNGI